MTLREITLEVAKGFDIIYFSGRKLGFARGGGICMRDKALCEQTDEVCACFHTHERNFAVIFFEAFFQLIQIEISLKRMRACQV